MKCRFDQWGGLKLTETILDSAVGLDLGQLDPVRCWMHINIRVASKVVSVTGWGLQGWP